MVLCQLPESRHTQVWPGLLRDNIISRYSLQPTTTYYPEKGCIRIKHTWSLESVKSTAPTMASRSITLAEIPTISLLYKLNRLAPASTTLNQPSQDFNNIISLIRNDITKLQVDCIVNAANESLLGGGGVDGAIHRGAGPELQAECRTLEGCDTGDAKITSAYELPCKKVIHTVGPIYRYERSRGVGPERLLRSCYRRCLDLAVQNGMRSIAFPAISTGVYGYPSTEAARAAIDEVRKYLAKPGMIEKLERIVFCSFERKDEIAYEETIP